ncbi:hypothetical protein [Flavihumibacter petaseus]|uniref:Uncharacterized protein n=1 Tax=Flavihumibacter petaseus NBRC 106054 TaxID=1220578 RepID=A0A0E9MX42_9BACT|nr:hypothetical protein [Flavihumibacter petaseus]GAO41981.1 hypothetical protein FPE01S_01_09940 [Flavihumibacter petaseus NBRC 106054]
MNNATDNRPKAMNVISRFFFRLVLLPRNLYRRWGIDLPQLELILQYKLTMDDRRPNTFQQTRSAGKKGGISNATLGTMFMALLMGLLYLIFFQAGRDNLTHLFFFFTAFLFMLASMLITDFTSVLIDVRDNQIILPKPVNDRTVLMAKILHIVVHLSRLVLPMALPTLIFLFLQQGFLAAVTLLLMIAIACGFTIFLINGAYLLVLKITSAEKFKAFISWFQIIFAIVLYGGYQLVPRMADMETFRQFSITDYWYARLLPPYWFSGGWLFCNGVAPGRTWLWLLLSLLSSFGSIWLVVEFLAPAFVRKLAGLQGGSTDTPVAAANQNYNPAGLGEKIAGIVCRSTIEKAAFLFSWKWTARSREFKMRVYPTFGYVMVWFALTFYKSFTGNTIPHKLLPVFLGLIYFSSFILFNALQYMNHTDQYKAAWVFYVSPVDRPGQLVMGNYKSMLFKFYLPIAAALLIAGGILLGPSALPNLLLALTNLLVISGLVVILQHRKLPASMPPSIENKGGAFLRAMGLLLICGIVAGGHFLLYRFHLVILSLNVLSIVAVVVIFQQIRNTDWRSMKTA